MKTQMRSTALDSHSLWKAQRKRLLIRNLRNNYDLYLFLLPTLLFFLIFHYGPMYGVQIAFKDYKASLGILGSRWSDPIFYNFERLFRTPMFAMVLKNTLTLSIISLAFGFFPPIFLALMLHQVSNLKYKRFIQTVTYAPHFITTVVMVSMLFALLSYSNGVVNNMLEAIGLGRFAFMRDAKYFRGVYVVSGIWQEMGFSAVIYIAALSGISQELHEAALIDGANKVQRIWHIDIPGILPTVVILLILRSGSLMGVGFQKIYLMQTSLNLPASEVISTYVYKVGLEQADFSFASAVGLFNSVVNFIMIISVNFLSRKLSETSLW